MTSYTAMVLSDLLDAFASNEPVPGGGSAAALAGALGASLLIMVAGLPRTRRGTPEEVADLAEASARLRPLRDTLASLVERDSQAYERVLEALRLPRADTAAVSARRAAIDTAMRDAIEVPMDTMRACQQALRGALVVAANGSAHAMSDTGTAVHLLVAGLRGAALNVDINLKSITDPAFAARVASERDQLTSDADHDARKAADLLE